MDLTAIYTKEPEGWYTVEILELPGCVSYGETLEEAETMIKEASSAYLESVWKHNQQDILKKHSFIWSLHVNEAVFSWWNNKVLA